MLKRGAMKKILSLVALLGTVAGSASAAPYYLSQPVGGALTPYDWQPVYSIEGVYNFVDGDFLPDTYGARLNFSLYNNAVSTVRHQFSISVGYEYGSDKFGEGADRFKVDLNRIPLTLGYDANIVLTDHVMLDLGAKAGYAWGEIKDESYDRNLILQQSSDTVGGFTFSLGAGVKIQCSDSIYVKVGYEFSRTFYGKVIEDDYNANYGQHSIVIGVGALF